MAEIGFRNIKAYAQAWRDICLGDQRLLSIRFARMIELYEDLASGEEFLSITTAHVEREHSLLVLTNKRLVCVTRTTMDKKPPLTRRLHLIETASAEPGEKGQMSLRVQGSGAEFLAHKVDRAEDFAKLVLEAAAAARADQPPAPPAAAAPPAITTDVLAQLERLGALRETGVITEAEFDALKGRLLGAG